MYVVTFMDRKLFLKSQNIPFFNEYTIACLSTLIKVGLTLFELFPVCGHYKPRCLSNILYIAVYDIYIFPQVINWELDGWII